MTQGKTSTAKRFLLPIIWMLLIFIVSGDLGSMNNTSAFLVPLIRTFFSEISSEALSQLLLIIRKSGHVFEYAVLAVLWLKALGTKTGGIDRQQVLIGILFTVAYAGLDELHHAFVNSRTGSLLDVGIDILGAFLGLGVWKSIQFYRQGSYDRSNNGLNSG